MQTSRPLGRLKPTLSLPDVALSHASSSSRGQVNPLLTSKAKYLRAEGPYITYQMIKRQEEKVGIRQENKKRWLTKIGFRSAAKSKERFIPNYVQASPSANPTHHSFRDTRRDHWIAGAFRPPAYLSRPD